MSTLTAVVLIADGSEEIEAVTVIDVLRRAAVDVTVAAVGAAEDKIVTMSRKTKLVADTSLDSIDTQQKFDVVVVPGGAKVRRRWPAIGIGAELKITLSMCGQWMHDRAQRRLAMTNVCKRYWRRSARARAR